MPNKENFEKPKFIEVSLIIILTLWFNNLQFSI